MNYVGTGHFLSQYSPATAKVNEQVLREATILMGKPLAEATAEDIISYSKAISSCGKLTQKRKLSTLSAWYKYLINRDVIEKSPMRAIRLPKADRAKTIKWLRKDEADLLLNSLTGQERAIIAAGLSGLRISEIASLNVDQVRDGRLWNVEGKGGKVRTVPLTSQAWGAIQYWAQERGSGPLFTLKGGKRISPRSIQNIVSRAATEALGRHVHPHVLRHSAATMLAKADVPILKIGRILGHANPSVTEIYIHLDDDDLAAEVRKLDNAPTRKSHLRLVYSKAS